MSRVSVCIPSYNASPYIGETIESVLDSTYSNLEIIVNDDASTDGTREIVESFDDDRIRFFQNESNLGAPKNWNRALAKASGEYLGLLNHDDLYGPFWLTFAVHVLGKHPHIGWVSSAYRVIDAEGQALGVVSRLPETREYSQREALLCLAQLHGLGPTYIARREALEDVGYYDEDAGPAADIDLFLRLALKDLPLYYSNTPHAAWRWHDNNLTHQWGPVEQTTDYLKMLDKAFGDDTLPQELRDYERRCYIYFYRRMLNRSKRLLEKGDLETVQRILGVLHANEYGIRQDPESVWKRESRELC